MFMHGMVLLSLHESMTHAVTSPYLSLHEKHRCRIIELINIGARGSNTDQIDRPNHTYRHKQISSIIHFNTLT